MFKITNNISFVQFWDFSKDLSFSIWTEGDDKHDPD